MGQGGGQVVSVLAFNLTIRVRIPLTHTVYSVEFVFEKTENKKVDTRVQIYDSIAFIGKISQLM